MIYIFEGIHGGGKTTAAKAVGLEVKKGAFSRLPFIKRALKEDNVVWDRLFALDYLKASGYAIKELNDYLKTRNDIKCYMYICDREVAWQR